MLLEQPIASSGHPNWLQGLQSAGLSLDRIANQINHLYGAFNAIDFSITCAFYELSRHPDWVKILRTEFKQVLGDRPYPTRADFPLLAHTMNFMQEVLRMYPVTMAVARRTGAAIEVDGEQIPKGTEVMILLYALHHHPDFWENPETFDPNRWANAIGPCPPYAYIPFLEGPSMYRQALGGARICGHSSCPFAPL
ncbi:MAG: cytochrome P450 [Pseudanabaena sp. RU_4_16]|nr:cytochrome P450 [Pseudanabaena sp. RU_4_16]